MNPGLSLLGCRKSGSGGWLIVTEPLKDADADVKLGNVPAFKLGNALFVKLGSTLPVRLGRLPAFRLGKVPGLNDGAVNVKLTVWLPVIMFSLAAFRT